MYNDKRSILNDRGDCLGNMIIYLSIFLSFLATLFMTSAWIRKATDIGLVGKDMNKPDRPDVAEMGGICVVFGFLVGMLFYIGMGTFYLHSADYHVILACICTILMMTIIGMMDDSLGWKKGISQWKKPILTIPAAMPMMVINAGHSTMDLWFIGAVDWGIFYPLAIIPIGIVGAANAYNMLAGYNGLEAGMAYHKRPGDPGADDRRDHGKNPDGGRWGDEDTTDAC